MYKKCQYVLKYITPSGEKVTSYPGTPHSATSMLNSVKDDNPEVKLLDAKTGEVLIEAKNGKIIYIAEGRNV